MRAAGRIPFGAYALPIPTSERRLPVIVSPTIQMIAGLGDAAEDAEKRQALFKRAVMESALKTAAVQMGISVTLNCVPILGQALSGLYAVVNTFLSHRYKKQAQEAGEEWKAKLVDLAESYKQKMLDAQRAVAEEEYPAAQQLALSNEPLDNESPLAVESAVGSVQVDLAEGIPVDPEDAALVQGDPAKAVPLGVDGLGNWIIALPVRTVHVDLGPVGLAGEDYQEALGSWFDSARKAVSKPLSRITKRVTALPVIKQVVAPVVKKVAPIAARVTAEVRMRPVAIVGKVTLRQTSWILSAAGDKKHAAKMREMEKAWDRRSNYMIKRAADAMVHPKKAAQDIRKGFRILTGADLVDTINEKMAGIYDTTRDQLEQQLARTKRTVATPQYHNEIRLQLARAIRGDPEQMAKAQAVAGKEASLESRALSGKLTPDGGAMSAILASLTAVGGLFAVAAANR